MRRHRGPSPSNDRRNTIRCLVATVFLCGPLSITEASAANLDEVPLAFKGSTIAVPRSYGRLVDVVESNQIHYLYFEDSEGVIRILLVGSKGTSVRANQQLEILSPDVYIIPRDASSSPPVDKIRSY